ncbi:hypothetical protein HBI48_132670 [Parastagonospora nodorum]|nr:hypothetical protein HBI48_132670 [Parastagonospora nodorum]
MTDSPRARTPINLSAVLYEQSAAQPGLPAEVSNIDLNFVPSVAFIPNVYIANSLRARTLINLSAVLYEQAAARTSLPAKVSNIDLNFVPGVAFIPNVYIADSLRARTLINLSAVLYKQAAARTSLSAKVSNISLPAKVGIIDLDFVPSVTFDAIGNVELTGDLLGNADRVNNNNNNVAPTLQFSPTALLNPRLLALKRPASSGSDLNCGRTDPTIATSLAKRIKTNEDRKKSTHRQGFNSSSSDDDNAHTVPYPNLKKYLGNSSQQGRIKVSFSENSLLRLVFELQRYDYYNLQDSDSLTQIQAIDPIISKSDEVPTQELSSYIKTELLRDNSRKFYRLVITSEDTHYKQIIKKAYIMLLERASLILFIT